MGSAATATGGAALAEGALAVEGGAAPLLLVAGRPLGPLAFFTVVSLAGSTSPSSSTFRMFSTELDMFASDEP